VGHLEYGSTIQDATKVVEIDSKYTQKYIVGRSCVAYKQLEDYLDDDYLVINFPYLSWKVEINRWPSKPYLGFLGHIAETKATIISRFNGRG
jgi:hypothetical protein